MIWRIIFSILFFVTMTGSAAQELKVMSYNIHHGRNQQGKVDLKAIAEVIKKSGADIIGLQEVDSVCRRSGNVDQMKVLGKLTRMYYAFGKHFGFDGGSYGLGILSRHPIAQVSQQRITSFSESKDNPKTLVFLTADVSVNSAKTVRFGTVHFDYRKDPAIRLKQSQEVFRFTDQINHPVILTGDLNAEPERTEIKNLFNIFTDTDTSGTYTFPAEQPVKKIDYILVSKSHLEKVVSHKVINEPNASDHRPVLANVMIKY